MDVYSFLKGLPAVLGIAGFFAYLWKGQSQVGGQIFAEIVRKLRNDPNVHVEQYKDLTPAKIGNLIKVDESVRSAVNEGDRKLLRLLILLQHILTALVFLVCAALIAWSIWLLTRPQPLSVIVKPPVSNDAQTGNLLVDLFPVRVEWTSSGLDENVSVYLENVRGQQKDAQEVGPI
jgi:hypothetical protein